jgi:hypothetical protein
VIAAAQAAVFDVAKLQGCAAVRAAQREQTELALIIAKHHQVFAKQTPANRPGFKFAGEADGMPVAAHHGAARSSGANVSDEFVFSYAERHEETPESELAVLEVGGKIFEKLAMSQFASQERFLTSFEMTCSGT